MSINKANTHILPVEFKYYAPTSLDEALQLLSEHRGDSAILAGGTDLLVKMKQRLVEPRHVINIKHIGELSSIEERQDGIYIGAATKLRAVEKSEMIKEEVPVLQEAVRSIGSVQIRNMATIGGNLCNASPAADSAIALLALGSETIIASLDGLRDVRIEAFFTGPGTTALGKNELLVGLFVPYLSEDCGTSFMKTGRTSLDIATVNIATLVRLRNGVISECRIALGAVAPTPIRVWEAEGFLKGKKPSDEVLGEAARIAVECIRPITDVRATAEYRKEVSKALVMDSLARARKRGLKR